MTKTRKQQLFGDVYQALQITNDTSQFPEFLKKIYLSSKRGYLKLISEDAQLKPIFEDFQSKTDFLAELYPLSDSSRLFYYFNKLSSPLKCCICGKTLTAHMQPTSTTLVKHCSIQCLNQDPAIQLKSKSTKIKNHTTAFDQLEKQKAKNQQRFGCDFYVQSEDFKNKAKARMLQNGYDHPMHSKEIKDKMSQSYFEKTGYHSTLANPEIQQKIKAKNQQTFNVDYPFQSTAIRQQAQRNSAKTQKVLFYENTLLKDSRIEPLFTIDDYLAHSGDVMHEFDWKCRECGSVFSSRIIWGNHEHVSCSKCHPRLCQTSLIEQEVVEFLRGFKAFNIINGQKDNRDIIPPQEIDIIVKDAATSQTKLLIEIDGLYWHSTACGKDSQYHLSKTDLCEKQELQLVHIFEDEWKQSSEIVKSRLCTLLGIYDVRVYARKCIVKEISSKDSASFQQKYHLQGKSQAKVNLGLFHCNELIAVMTFGHKRKIFSQKTHNSENEWELIRFCTKSGYHVIGAAGKLLKHFEVHYCPDSIVSYADRRWSRGKLYEALGFQLDHVSKPNYWYIDPKHNGMRFYRYAFRKSQLSKILSKYDESKTETQNMLDNGFNMIWDCGNLVFKKHAKETK